MFKRMSQNKCHFCYKPEFLTISNGDNLNILKKLFISSKLIIFQFQEPDKKYFLSGIKIYFKYNKI